MAHVSDFKQYVHKAISFFFDQFGDVCCIEPCVAKVHTDGILQNYCSFPFDFFGEKIHKDIKDSIFLPQHKAVKILYL